MVARIFTMFVVMIATSANAQYFDDAHAVEIQAFERKDDTTFTLTVRPSSKHKITGHSYFDSCSAVTVHGEFRRLRVVTSLEPYVLRISRESHVKSVDALEFSFHTGREIYFGPWGIGLVPIDKRNPCEVKSRALTTQVQGDLITVHSYHDAT